MRLICFVWLGFCCAVHLPPVLRSTAEGGQYCYGGRAAGAGALNFDLVGFATLNSLGQNGTSGGSAGTPRPTNVQVSTVGEFVLYCQTNATLLVEVMNDIDCSSLRNASGGFPADYPVGESW